MLPVLDFDRTRLDSVELYPFKKAVEAGVGGVMIGHLHVSELDEKPASISSEVITSLLRKELHFSGLVFTDALEMKGISKNADDLCVQALMAGNDMLLVPRNLKKSLESVMRAVKSGKLTEDVITKKCRKVLTYKYALGLSHKQQVAAEGIENRICSAKSDSLMIALEKAAVTVLKDSVDVLPLDLSLSENILLSLSSSLSEAYPFYKELKESVSLSWLHGNADSLQQIQERVAPAHQVIVAVHQTKDLSAFLPFLEKVAADKPLVVVCFASQKVLQEMSSVLKKASAVILAHTDKAEIQRYVADVMTGQDLVDGRLSVDMNGLWKSGTGLTIDPDKPRSYSPEELGMDSKILLAIDTIAEEGIVLLQNKGNVLPIDLNKASKIAVIGENALKMMTVGGGSSSLKVKHEISPLDGLKKRVAGKAEVLFARGYVGDASGEYNGVVTGQDLSDNRSPEELIAEAVSLAKECDYVIFFGGLNKSAGQDCEDADRAQLGLPYGQDQLIEALSKVNKNLIVVNISGNAVAMPWVKSVPSIVPAWFLGSEAGSAIASVLLGDVNPSGKLPFTFPVCLEDVGAHKLGEYPGVKRENENIWDAKYNEGIFVGYRWLDKENIKPLFASGHGLSYTQFEYGKVTLDSKEMTQDGKIVLTVPVTNVGKREGAEIVQLYICDKKSSLSRPEKELKGFCKVKLAAGETKTVSFTIDKSSLSFFDDKQHKWVAEPGKFEAVIAASAEDIKSKTVFELK